MNFINFICFERHLGLFHALHQILITHFVRASSSYVSAATIKIAHMIESLQVDTQEGAVFGSH